MATGFVYVLSNPAMPGIVKIGFTLRPVLDRAQDLSNVISSMPQPFIGSAARLGRALPSAGDKARGVSRAVENMACDILVNRRIREDAMARKELMTDAQWLELKPQFEKTAAEFRGDITTFESAWGALLLGTQYGWKVSFLVHSQSTIKKYEEITGRKFRDVCPPETKLSKKSIGYVALQKVSSFWKAVRGETKDVRSPIAT